MKSMKPRAFSAQLRQLIEESALSQNEIAKRSRVDQATLKQFVNGERELRTDILDRLTGGLGLEVVHEDQPRSKEGR